MKFLEERAKKISAFSGIIEEIAKRMGKDKVFEDMEKLTNNPEWETLTTFAVNVRNYLADKAFDVEEDDKTRFGRKMYSEGLLDIASLPIFIKDAKEKNKTLKERLEEFKNRALRKKYNPTL
jgi:hypothetical protein